MTNVTDPDHTEVPLCVELHVLELRRSEWFGSSGINHIIKGYEGMNLI